MRAWAFLLGGMIVWAIHFFALYIVVSIFLTSTLTRALVLAITLACLSAAGYILRRATKEWAGSTDAPDKWGHGLAALFAALALVAVIWQGLPARPEEDTYELQAFMRISYDVS